VVSELIKRDAFGEIRLLEREGRRVVVRDLARVRPWLRPLARHGLRREARALAMLSGIPGIPRLLALDGNRLEREYLPGRPLMEARPQTPAFFRAARRLLAAVHRRGVVHNDLAKEANWLVLADGSPGLVDFQLARVAPARGRLQRLLAREDLRHLLKHKRSYCPASLTPIERRLLERPSWLRRLWFATGKRLYRWYTRRTGFRDREGRGRDG
jgi:predicted Ser/Thr protein kinase